MNTLGLVNKLNRIILLDVDGTLCVDGVVSKEAIKAIQRLRNQKDLVLLCTGRCLGQLADILKIVDVDGAITNNGAYAYLSDQTFYHQPIDRQTIEKLADYSYCLGLLTKDTYAVMNYDADIFKRFMSFFKVNEPQVVTKNFLLEQDVYSLGIYTDKDISALETEFSNLKFIKICEIGYDIICKGVSKATPIRKLKAMFPSATFYGFGDNYNDIEFLSIVDYAIVMPSAPKEVLELADYIAYEGVGAAIEAFVEVKK